MKNTDNFITTTDVKSLIHLSNPEVVINSDTTISQVLAMLHNSGVSLATPCIQLKLVSFPSHEYHYHNNNNFIPQKTIYRRAPTKQPKHQHHSYCKRTTSNRYLLRYKYFLAAAVCLCWRITCLQFIPKYQRRF